MLGQRRQMVPYLVKLDLQITLQTLITKNSSDFAQAQL